MLDKGKNDSMLNAEELKQSLILENNFLIKIVDTIPAKMYFENEIQDKISTEKHSSMNKAAEAIKRKSNNHIELSAKGKHKWARLDPLLQKNVSQIHSELDKKKRRKKKKNRGVDNPSASLTRAANVEELQKRLQERIDLLQASRNATQNDPKAKKKLDRKLKKLKIKQKGNLLKPPEPPTDILKISKEKKKEINKEKPTFNKEGNLIYSKFDFSENGLENSKKSEYANKKTKVLLKKAEKKKEKIEKLKEEDPEKAETVLEKEKWKKAILKTEGVKIKDDPKLLKRSLKREEKKKKRSAKEWNERTQETEKKKQARQERRNRNIKQRKDEKRERKLKLAKKKGRIIPNV